MRKKLSTHQCQKILQRDIIIFADVVHTTLVCTTLVHTGKSLPEELIIAFPNAQYDKRLFIELQVQYMKTTSSEHVLYTNCFFVFVLTFRTFLVHNMF